MINTRSQASTPTCLHSGGNSEGPSGLRGSHSAAEACSSASHSPAAPSALSRCPFSEHAWPSLLPADLHPAPVSQGTTLGCSLAPTTPLTTTHLSRASPSQPGLLQGQPLLAVPLPRKRRDATPFARLFPKGGAHQSSTRRPCENANCRPHLQIGGEAQQSAFPDMFPG